VQRIDVDDSELDLIQSSVLELRKTFESHVTRDIQSRIYRLTSLRCLLQNHQSEMIEALKKDLGKPVLESLMMELNVAKNEIEFAIKNLKNWMARISVNMPFSLYPVKGYTVAEPLGMVLIISPWNYPLQLSLLPLIGAVAAGNTVLLKPSEMAPHSAKFLQNYLTAYVDDASIAVINGGINVTKAILQHRFDHIFFTGSGTVGKEVLRAAAEHLTPCTLELGGKSPCIVTADANLELAAEKIVWSKFTNAGQTCIAPDYLYIEASVKQPFLQLLTACIQRFYGSHPKESKDYGRIVNQRHFDRLLALLVNSGEVYSGADYDASTNYIAPTILTNCHPDSSIMQPSNEIFGPILPVLEYTELASVVRYINDRDKPLTLYLFTSSAESRNYVQTHTSSGSMVINHALIQASQLALPFGGVGASGMGRYHGKESFLSFSNTKSIIDNPGSSFWPDATRLLYPPATDFKKKILDTSTKLNIV